MFEEPSLLGSLKLQVHCIDHRVLESLIVKWITFSDSSDIFDSNDLSVSGARVRRKWLALNLEIIRVLY